MPIKRQRMLSPFLVIVPLLLALFGAAVYLYFFLYPGFQYIPEKDGLQVVLGSQPVDIPVILEEGEILFPLPFVRDYLDADLFWDEKEQRLTITTAGKVLQMRTGQLTAYLNRKPLTLHFPVTVHDGKPYLPLEFLQDFYRISIIFHEETNTVVVDKEEIPHLEAVLTRKAYLRVAPTMSGPRVVLLEPGEPVRVYREDNGWYYLRTTTGLLGYAPKYALQMRGIMAGRVPSPEKDDILPWRPLGGKVSLVWEHVTGVNPSVENINPMPGVNVVSPTWFHLDDEEGNIHNMADHRYVQWARERGYQVWALFSNNFDRDMTAAVLRSTEKREKVIDQMLAFAALYELDGINVDFENLHLEDRDYLTQFMREFAPMAREQGLTLSIDVTFPGGSVNWSLIYDRRALGEIVDYVMVMAYDEHWGTSPVAGSVSSLPWVERNLRRILEEVPAEKLLLGIPFYTRLWEVQYLEGGGEQVTSRAYGMERIQSILQGEGAEIVYDELAGQNYASYERPGKTYKVWLEDHLSLKSRLDLVEKYNLAGTAAWRRGFETRDVWELFAERLFVE